MPAMHHRASAWPGRRLPRGEMTLARIVALSLVLLAMLAVPLMLWKQRDRENDRREAAERAKAGAAAASAAKAGPAANKASVATTPVAKVRTAIAIIQRLGDFMACSGGGTRVGVKAASTARKAARAPTRTG
jgi:hypothetical protein